MTAHPTRVRTLRLALGFFVFLSMLDAQGPVVRPLRTWRDGFLSPSRVAKDEAGRIYISDASLSAVTVKDEYGRTLSIRRGLAMPLGVAVDRQGRVFVAEQGTGSVSIFNSDWTRLGQFGRGWGEFSLPNHVSVAADGTGQVYVVDSGADLVKVFDGDGHKLREFGSSGTGGGQFDFPTGIAVSPRGEVFVADQNNDRVQVFDRNGNWLRSLGKSGMLGSKFGRIQGLLVDAQNRLFVADAFKGIVHVLDPTSGATLGAVGSFGDGPGQLLGPSSLAIDRNNRLFVASTGSARVDVFGLDSYVDPSVLQATARLTPPVLARDADTGRRHGAVPYVVLNLSVPGIGADQILPDTVTFNDLAWMNPPGTFLKEFDQPGVPEFCAVFDLRALLATLPDGQSPVTVRGQLPGGRPFEAVVLVTVNPAGGEE